MSTSGYVGPSASRGWLRRLIKMVSIPVIAFALMISGANIAQAYVGSGALTPGFVGVKNPWPGPTGREMGTGILPNGWRVLCIETHATWPNTMTSPYEVGGHPKSAYLLNKYMATGDNYIAAALWYYVNVVDGMGASTYSDQTGWNEGVANHGASMTNALNTLINDANANAGPYYPGNLDLGAILDPNGAINHGTVQNAGVKNISGNWVSGASYTLTLNGPAVFLVNGTNTVSGTTVGGPISHDWKATGKGTVSVSINITGLAAVNVLFFPGSSSTYQDTVTIGSPDSVSGDDPIVTATAFQPSPSTTVGSKAIRVGEEALDNVALSGGTPNSAMPIVATLYGPFTTQPTTSTTVPTGAPVYATVNDTANFNGSGVVNMQVRSNPTSVGWYTWVVSGATTAENDAFSSSFGVESETFQVNYWTPALYSQSSNQWASPGAEVTDLVGLQDAPPNLVVTGTNTLYGPFDQSPEGLGTMPANAPVVGTVPLTGTVDEQGYFAVTTPSVVIGPSGYYTWVFTIDKIVANGVDYTEAAATAPFGDYSEGMYSYLPGLSTQVNTQQSTVGTTISDTLSLTGLKIGGGADEPVVQHQISGSLLGPVAPLKDADGNPTCVGIDWKADSVKQAAEFAPATLDNGTIDAGNASVSAGQYKATVAGCYTYTWDLFWLRPVGEVQRDSGNVSDLGGTKSETVLITTPLATTVVSKQIAGVGDKLTDVITVVGTSNQVGTITSTLYGPVQPTDKFTCASITPEQWATAVEADPTLAVSKEDIALTGDAVYTTAPVLNTSEGCYTWGTQLTFPATPEANVTSPLGDVTETTLSMWPTLTTVASIVDNGTGMSAMDTIVVTGTYGKSGIISGKILGPVDPVTEGTCSGIDWTNARVFSELVPVNVVGDGTYTTVPVEKVQQTGDMCFTFLETLTMTDEGAPTINAPAGITSETMMVTGSGGGVGVGTGLGINFSLPNSLMGWGGLLLLIGPAFYLLMANRRHKARFAL